jgi:hypothetical protein
MYMYIPVWMVIKATGHRSFDRLLFIPGQNLTGPSSQQYSNLAWASEKCYIYLMNQNIYDMIYNHPYRDIHVHGTYILIC